MPEFDYNKVCAFLDANNFQYTHRKNNKMCLHCGANLEDVHIAQFNDFCSAKCLDDFKVRLCDFETSASWEIYGRFWCNEMIHHSELVRNVSQVKANIKMLYEAIHIREQDTKIKNYAKKIVWMGHRFVPYTIGDSPEIRTAPSKYIGYISNSPRDHYRWQHYDFPSTNEKGSYRDGRKTDTAIELLDFSSCKLGKELSHDELLLAHEKYCKESLLHKPAPALPVRDKNGRTKDWTEIVNFFCYSPIQLPE